MNVTTLFYLLILAPHLTWAGIADGGLVAFERTMYIGLRQNCIACHGDGGIAVGHSVSDVKAAYAEAKTLVDFSEPTDSRFYKMVKRKHWLKYDSTALGMTEEEILKFMRQWWDEGESQAGKQFALVTQPLLLPKDLPLRESGKYLNINWNLELSEPRLKGCVASVDIQRATSTSGEIKGSYHLKNPAILCSLQSISIKGVYFSVSDQLASYENIYSWVDMSIEVNPSNKTVLSKQTMVLIERKAQDTISFLMENFSLH